MPLTVGTNSYVTIEESNAYLSDRYGKDEWATIEDTIKEKALISATDLVENTCIMDGIPTDEDQDLHFPIDEEVDVPQDIKDAQIEIAYEMAVQDISTFVDSSSDLKQLKGGSASLTFFENDTDPLTVVNNIAKAKLQRYGNCSFGSDTLTAVELYR